MTSPLLNQIPIPKDIPLPLPLPEGLLVFILILSFLIHILFINLMIGGSILTFWYEVKGKGNSDYDHLAREIASTITVNKSLAVVFGVAPLLSINVLYTLYFYSANALTGNIWISIIPWVTIAFLLFYLHKYTWDQLSGNKPLHLSILGAGIFSFLSIPFIFLTNINLMLFPEKWGEIKGFFDAMTLPNVFPRYFHFLTASMAITGLFLAWWFGRKSFGADKIFKNLTSQQLKMKMLNLALIATGLQFIFGPLLFLTLPSQGVTWKLFWLITGGVTAAVIVMVQLWKLQNEENHITGKRFYTTAGLFLIIIGFMGTGRHVYREGALATHKEMTAIRTEAHREAVRLAQKNLLSPKAETAIEKVLPGQNLFQTNCTVCHAANSRLVGPAMAEVIPGYRNNPEGLKKWIKEPGRKRMDFPAMTGFPHFTQKQLNDIAEYLLQETWSN